VWWQNNIGGKMIQFYISFYGIRTDDQFVVRVPEGCPSASPKKRQAPGMLDRRQSEMPSNQTSGNGSILTNAYSKWLQDPTPGAAPGAGFLLSPFGQVDGGVFNTQLNLQGSVSEVIVVDGDGIEYAR
jgi:hypothetical protein